MKNVGTRILWFICGLLLIAAGVICFCNQTLAYATLVWAVGFIMLFAGIADIVMFADAKDSTSGAGWYLAEGILAIILAFILLFNQWFTAELLPYMFCFWLIMTGIARIINSTDLKGRGTSGWGWLMAFGIIIIIIGVVLLFEPIFTAMAMGIVLGVVFIVEGVNAVLKAFFYDKMKDI